MSNAPTLASTTDSEAEMQAALATLDREDDRRPAAVAESQAPAATPEPAAPPATDAAPAAEAATAPTDDDEGDEPQSQEPNRPRRSRAKERIDQLVREAATKDREAADRAREAADLRRENEELRKRTVIPADTLPTIPGAKEPTPAPTASAVEEPMPPKPVQADYEDFDKYLEARDAWTDLRIERAEARAEAKADERARKILEDRDADDRKRQAESQQAQDQQSFQQRLDVARQVYPDFDAVLNAGTDLPVTPAMVDAIQDSPLSGHLLYYLNKKAADCAFIATLPPVAAMKEIGRLEGAISTWLRKQKAEPVVEPPAPETPRARAPQATPVSKAPPPPAQIRGASTNAGVPKDPSQITDLKEWERFRGIASDDE